MTKANSLSRWLAAAMAALMLLALLPARVWAAESTAYDTDGATAFTFTDIVITAKDGDYTGYDIDGTALTIEAAGTYIVSGSCQSGSITVKKGVTGVTLVLSGLTLTADGTAAIACNKSSGVTIVAQDGTTNILSDTETNNDDSYPDNTNAENAVIKCKDGSQVTLCGSGSLTVNANGKNGIKSGATTDEEGEAWLVIRDLTLSITGGTVLAAGGSAGMGITLSGDSQPYVMFGSTGTGGMGGGRPGSIGGQPGGSSDSATPPQLPSSSDSSTTPPQLPSGSDSSSDSRPTPPSGSNGSQPTPPDDGGATPPELPDGQTPSQDSRQPGGQFPGQTDGQSGSSISISKGSTFTIRSSDGTAVYTGEAVYDARFVFFSSAAMTSGETYTLTSGGTELATATAGGTGTAAVTIPDTSADTADTHQTSDSHTGLYIALGTVAVLGAAAMVVVILRKQKKA